MSSILYEHSHTEEEDERQDAPSADEREEIEYPQLPHHDKITGNEKQLQQDPDLDLDIPPVDGPSPKRRASIARKAGLNIGRPVRTLHVTDYNNLNLSPKRLPVVVSPKSASRQSADSGIGSDAAGDEEAADENEDVWLEGQITQSRLPRKIKKPEPALTMSEKLAAVEAEALEAQQQVSSSLSNVGTKRKYGASTKSRKATRRRSTLNPEELIELMRMT